MAELPEDIISHVLELQKQLLIIINQATLTSYAILENYGETETTLFALEDLDNARDRANIYYNRLHTIMGIIAETQPNASRAMLELLERSINETQATIAATEATINEEKRGFNLS